MAAHAQAARPSADTSSVPDRLGRLPAPESGFSARGHPGRAAGRTPEPRRPASHTCRPERRPRSKPGARSGPGRHIRLAEGQDPAALKAEAQRTATTSATSTYGFELRGFGLRATISALAKPALVNSSRRATPSLAPEIQANQFRSLPRSPSGRGPFRINSATNA